MLGFKSFNTATSILSGVEAMHMIKKEQIDLRDQVYPKSERIHPSIVWDCSIRYDSARNICVLFSFALSLHQNLQIRCALIVPF